MSLLKPLLLASALTLSANPHAATFVVGVEDNAYLPFWSSEGGQYQGYAREILDAFGAKTGHRFEYRPLPVDRLYAAFAAGTVDFKFPDHAAWGQDSKRGLSIHYSDPVAPFVDGVVVLPTAKGKGSNALKQLGTLAGFTPYDYLDAIKTGRIKLTERTNLDELLTMAFDGRIDGIYYNPLVIQNRLLANGHKADALSFDPTLPHSRSDYRLSTLKHDTIIARFNTFLTEDAALIDKLKERHGIKRHLGWRRWGIGD